MGADEQLLYESRVRRRQAVVAGVAAVLLFAAAASQLAGPQEKVQEATLDLILAHRRAALVIVGAILQGAALAALVWTLSFLAEVTRARRPEMIAVLRPVAVVAGIAAAVAGVVYAIYVVIKAGQFVSHGTQTYMEAHQLVSGALKPVLQTLDVVAQFALAIVIVLIALNAMRVGLLTRGMGYLGIFVGAAGILLIGSPPSLLLQIVWLAGLAVLFAGRWMGGDPPAWRTGRAEPWPSSQEMRQQRMREASGRGDRRASGEREKAAGARDSETVGASPAPRTRASTPKRKRKRRR